VIHGGEAPRESVDPGLDCLAVIVFAHAGHWLPQLLYLAPVVVMLVALGVGKVREKRRR
jgi:hypothetical protein